MAEEHKRSFVLYFDAYLSIEVLSMEQRGVLMTMLFQYAREAEESGMDPLTFLERCSDLSPETRVAFSFLAETIRRDTEKWKAKQQRYQAAAARRLEEHAGSPPSGAGKSGRMPQSHPNDVAWMKPYIDQRDKS